MSLVIACRAAPSQGRDAPAPSGAVSLWALTQGECFDVYSAPTAEGEAAVVLPCSAPHSLELISLAPALFVNNDGPYPGERAVSDSAGLSCQKAFVDYVGVFDDVSIYNYVYLVMQKEAWDAGERRIPCSAGPDDTKAKLTVSVKGANR